jgi:hypothetical protein
VTPQATSLAGKSGALPHRRNVLAGEASANNINWSDIFAPELGYVFELPEVGPVFRQHAPAEWVDLAEGDGFEAARALQAKAETAYARKQV